MGNNTGAEKKTQAPVATGAAPAAAKPAAPKQPMGKQAPEVAAGMCRGQGCKGKSDRFDFCAEHYEQFKFGLINKLGRQVPDFEKKWDHYEAYKAKQIGLKKVA